MLVLGQRKAWSFGSPTLLLSIYQGWTALSVIIIAEFIHNQMRNLGRDDVARYM